MYLSRLALTNYRNFRSLELSLPTGMVVLMGANAQGKSNLLEAAYLLAIAKSYRATSERELVHWEAFEEASSTGLGQGLITGEVELESGHLRVVIGLQVTAVEGVGGPLVQKQIRVNGLSTTASGLVGRVNAVLFTASDIELVQGSPSLRRRFLDILLSQVDRSYMRSLQRYQRVLAQRNHLLRLIREGRSSRQELDFWDAELVKEGTTVITRRHQVIGQLAPLAMRAYEGLAGNREELTVTFQPSVPAPELAGVLREQRDREVGAGMTLSGPHRDDFALAVEGMSAAIYASRGQARTIALALRLAEATFLKEERREEPILLLDDVLSELDTQRRHQVLEEAGRYQQALVTTAEPALVRDVPLKPSAVFTVRQGQVEPA